MWHDDLGIYGPRGNGGLSFEQRKSAEKVPRASERWLGSAISEVLFEAGFLSAVTGVRLADGREVVVKVRRCMPRLHAAHLVQRRVWQCGYPAPGPLVPPMPLDAAARPVPGAARDRPR
jgi:hypothetical protein